MKQEMDHLVLVVVKVAGIVENAQRIGPPAVGWLADGTG